MKAPASRIDALIGACRETGHPLDFNRLLEREFLRAAAAVATERRLDEAIPKLGTLVVASPFDAAIHDAFGKVHNRSAYSTYASDLLPRDLAAYLGRDFRGMRLGSPPPPT